MKEAQERADLAESAAGKRRAEEQVLYQQELEKQLEEGERRKQAAYEEFLREKLLIDEIVRKVYEEDERWASSLGRGRVGRPLVPLLLWGLMVALEVCWGRRSNPPQPPSGASLRRAFW